MCEIIRLVTGPYKANCYILHQSGLAVVIDPGADAEVISGRIESMGLKLLSVLCTHGHIDHIGAVAEVKRRFGVPAYIHGADQALVRRAHLYAAFFKASGRIEIPTFEENLKDHLGGLTIGPFSFTVIETPGHSNGGVCLISGSDLFSGDTLFAKGHGGIKLPGGDVAKFEQSIATLRALDPDFTVYPGHGRAARLGDALKDVEFTDA